MRFTKVTSQSKFTLKNCNISETKADIGELQPLHERER